MWRPDVLFFFLDCWDKHASQQKITTPDSLAFYRFTANSCSPTRGLQAPTLSSWRSTGCYSSLHEVYILLKKPSLCPFCVLRVPFSTFLWSTSSHSIPPKAFQMSTSSCIFSAAAMVTITFYSLPVVNSILSWNLGSHFSHFWSIKFPSPVFLWSTSSYSHLMVWKCLSQPSWGLLQPSWCLQAPVPAIQVSTSFWSCPVVHSSLSWGLPAPTPAFTGSTVSYQVFNQVSKFQTQHSWGLEAPSAFLKIQFDCYNKKLVFKFQTLNK